MKRKSIVTLCAIALMLVLSLSVLAACNKNKHEFSSEWKSDENSHWHECVTKKHTDTSEKLPHDFNDGEITTQPTETEDGVKTFTCNTCGYKKTESIAKLTHTHTYSQQWTADDNYHWHVATCEHTSEISGKAVHTWNDGVITKAATATENGEKTYTCTVCQKTKVVEIDATGAQTNTLALKDGVTLGKTYDGQSVALTKDMFLYGGNGEVTFTYRAKDAAVFDTDAPFVAGEYVVKVSVAATSEWKEVEKEFDFAIAKVKLASIEKTFEMRYDGATTEFDLTSKITEKVAGDDISLVVEMNGFAVGSTVKEVKFTGDDACNYTYDTAKLSVEIGKAIINIGQVSYTMQYKGGEWKTVFTLAAGDGVVEKDGVLENVSFEVLQDNVADWANKKSYALYTETATKASNIERVRLVGTDAGNYTFACDEDGNLGATLYCNVKETASDAILDPLNDYDWGGLIVDNVTFANKKLVVGGYQGEITDKLIDDENNFKQLKFEMFVRGTEIKIAQGTRILWESDDCEHVYNDCELIPGIGGPANLEINLLKNVDGYTDENGYWICEQQNVNLTLKVTETTDVAEANQDLFEDGLVKAGYALVKYTHSAEDSASMNVELTEGATGTIETHVYGFVDGRFTELTLNGGSYDVEKGQTYYIVVFVKTAGTGNAQIVLMG